MTKRKARNPEGANESRFDRILRNFVDEEIPPSPADTAYLIFLCADLQAALKRVALKNLPELANNLAAAIVRGDYENQRV